MLAVLSLLSLLLLAEPAMAAPQAPTQLTVKPGTSLPAHLSGNPYTYVTVSWTQNDPTAAGSRVCIVRSAKPSMDQHVCMIEVDYDAPTTTSKRIKLVQGETYSFSVFSYDSSSPRHFSPPITATLHAARLTKTQSRPQVYIGESVAFTAQFIDGRTGSPIAHKTVKFWKNEWSGEGWKRIAALQTDGHGRAAVSTQPTHTTEYYWTFDGNDEQFSVLSEGFVQVNYRMGARLSSATAAPDQHVKIYGRVRPNRDHVHVWLSEYEPSGPCGPGMYRNGQEVKAKVQRLPDGHTAFGYIMSISDSTVGRHRFQTAIDATHHMGNGLSPEVTLTVGTGAGARALPSVLVRPAC